MLIQRVAMVLASCLLLTAQSEDQVRMSQQAREMMANGRFAEAVPLYRELVKAIPGNPGLMLNLGMAQHMSGDDRAAIAQFQAVLKLEPSAFPALAMMGAARIRLGQPAAAVQPLQEALRIQPQNADVRRMLAEALLATGRHIEAADHFHRLATADPRNAHALYGLGRSYEAIALNSFEEIGRKAPGSAWWLALIAESRAKQKQNSSAFYFYRQALERNPRLRGAHAGLASIYQDSGHADWAQTEAKKEESLGAPDCGKAVAECHYHSARYREVLVATREAATPEALYWRAKAGNALALETFAQLEGMGPSLPLHRFRADQYRAQGRYRDAVEELKKALALRPGDLLLQRDLATTIYLSRDFAAAEPLLRQLLDQQPEAADLQFLLGDALLQTQQTEKAIPLLTSAVQGDPKLLPAHSALGRALLQTGEGEKAIPHLKAALPMDEDGSLHYQLTRAYQTAGHTELAAETMRRYQEIQKANAAAKKELDQQAEITAPEPQ